MAALPGSVGDDRITGEQAALRRVATLVGSGASPEEVFAAVTEEAGRLLGADFTMMDRYDPDGARTVVANWISDSSAFPIGVQTRLAGHNVPTLVFRTRRAARIDDYASASGPIAELGRGFGFRASVGVPVSVEGRLWGVMVAGSRVGPLPAGAEARLAGFTELAATAIANAQARVEVRGFADEQAALRRVATLVASGAVPEEVFAAVAEEAGRLMGADYTTMARYDPVGAGTVVAAWSSAGRAFPVGYQQRLGDLDLPTLVYQTGQAARIDDYARSTGRSAEVVRELGFRASVGVPVSVEGRLWGLMIAGSRTGPLPASAEARLAGFTELAATAIANAQARVELRGFADEQAALRRVATLVASGAAPEEVFAAVTEEAGRLLVTNYASMSRYDPDGKRTVVATWDSTGRAFHLGARLGLGGMNVTTLVYQTGRAARMDDYDGAFGPVADLARQFGLRATVGVPVSAERRLWGVMVVGSRAGPLRAGAEAQLAGFTELAGTAIANAEAQAALTASRARIVATADATRRRIERSLHDGAQQRLVSLALKLRAAEAAAPPALGGELDEVAAGLDGVLDDLREIARGLHPAVLAESGLAAALTILARRSAVPVDLDIQVDRRLPDPVEIAAYYTVSEALTNTAKHARATTAGIQVAERDGVLHVHVSDNGSGGAGFGHGSGLVGLKDRAEALGGHLELHSAPGEGTTLDITLPLDTLPLDEPGRPGPPPVAAGPVGSSAPAPDVRSPG